LFLFLCSKTVQAITTILDNRPKLQQSKPGAKYPPAADVDTLKTEEKLWNSSLSEWKYEMKMNNVPTYLLPKAKGNQSEGGARAGTLVVCPVIALTQWKTEIEKFTEAGQLTVIIYHGPNRTSKNAREMLRMYDVVLTTYQVLQADFRKMTSPNRVKCPNCGNKFKVSPSSP
jgi:SNF2 family DNA or RNA helicase